MHSLQSIGVSVSNSWAAAYFLKRSFALTPDLICWSSLAIDLIRQNARTCLDGPDKMPTKKLGRTKCQPQKKVRTKCQPLVGIMSGWHFVRLAFCPVSILSAHHILQLAWYQTWNCRVYYVCFGFSCKNITCKCPYSTSCLNAHSAYCCHKPHQFFWMNFFLF